MKKLEHLKNHYTDEFGRDIYRYAVREDVPNEIIVEYINMLIDVVNELQEKLLNTEK